MKITITGSLGHIGKPLTETLVNAGHNVTVISSTAARSAAIEALGATPAIGSVEDAAFLSTAFAGADAVFALTPPNLGGANVIANTTAAGQAIAKAIESSGVKRLVMLSSLGAEHPMGTGPIAGLHNIEEIYSKLEGVHVTILRAGLFYINLFNDIPVIKNMNIIGANYPDSLNIPMVHHADIATAAAEELVKKGDGYDVRYIVSDIRKPSEIAKVLGAAIGKPGLNWVEFTDEQSNQGMIGAGLPAEIAGLYTEMGKAFREGKITTLYKNQGSPVTGSVKLEEFAREFEGAFSK